MTNRLLPGIGTKIKIAHGDVSLSKDGQTYICRIALNTESQEWQISSRFDADAGWWTPVDGQSRSGLLVFLTDRPDATDTHVRVASIWKEGSAVWADPIKDSV